jgi:type II secretory pathway pseudopilin PulG
MWANKNSGFTIVETLIVLAVSSAIFISTALLIQGQIERYRTRDAAINLEASVRDVFNDVATGYFPGAEAGVTNTNFVYAGKQLTFSNDDIDVKTLSADAVPGGTFTKSGLGISEILGKDDLKKYTWDIKPTSGSIGKTYYILFNNFGPVTGDFKSGALGVGIYSGENLVPVKDELVCFTNGAKKTSLTIAPGGQLGINMQLDNTSGLC